MLTPEFRERVEEACLYGQRVKYSRDEKRQADEKRLEFFKEALESGEFTDKEDIAFLLWNISDTCALLRDCEKLYENHKRFAEHLKAMPDKYLFWCVCDASQKFTLQLGGYNDLWYDLYRYACGHNQVVTAENEYIAYESHRAALNRVGQTECDDDDLRYACKEFEKFLGQTKDSEQYEFYDMIYKTGTMKIFGNMYPNIGTACKKFFGGLNSSEEKSIYVCGEWKKLNGLRSQRNRSVVAVTAAINAMIDCGYNMDNIISLYNEAVENGLPHNAYIEKRIK